VLAARAAHAVNLRRPERGLGVRWLELNVENATQALRMRLAQREGAEEMLTRTRPGA
jgi:hypothetical protein